MAEQEYRIYGPPGTGKTTRVVREARRAAERFGADRVSICTLTNSAVREVAGRSGLPLPAENVTTLHARCKRALGAGPPAEELAHEFVLDNPRYASCFPKGILRGKGGEDTNEVVLAGGQLSAYEQAGIHRQQMVPEAQWDRDALDWYRAWRGWCREHGTMDYTAWLEAALATDCLPQQDVVFVDEAQDHTPLQLAVIRHWRAKWLILVGDDDQSLYEWSGAIPREFFLPELPGHEQVLAQSFRVPRAVHHVADAWIQGLRERRVKQYIPRDDAGYVRRTSFTLDDAKPSSGRLPPGLLEFDGTKMVLASCDYMLAHVRGALITRGVPFHNPYRAQANLNPLRVLGKVIEAYLRGGWTMGDAARWLDCLTGEAAFQYGKKGSFIERCKAEPNARLDMEELRAVLKPDAYSLAIRQDLDIFNQAWRLKSTLNWQYALRVYRRPEAEWAPRIVLGTIHSVKGGEADHVWLWPDLSPAAVRDWQAFGDGRIRRLFYVAMTRARCGLTLGEPGRSLSCGSLTSLVSSVTSRG